MNFSATVEIAAAPETVWGVLSDVERWPEWTPSVRSVRRLDGGPLAVGSRVRIHQPKLLPATWRVTKLMEGRAFTWVTTSPGVRVTAGHWVEPHASGSRVILSLAFSEWFGPLVGRLTAGITRRYIEMESQGLKARSEQRQET